MFVFLNSIVKILQKKKRSKFYESNIHLLIGKTAKITEIISQDTAYAQVNGEIWMAKLQNKEQKLNIGQEALIIGVKGCHLQINLLNQEI